MSSAAAAGHPSQDSSHARDQPASGDQLISRPVPEGAPFIIVLNSGSGKQETDRVRESLGSELTRAGRKFELHEVDDPKELKSVAERCVALARQQRGVVVAAGGDGTINTVAEATLGSGCPFGVLPLGTFNYFSRTHGIPSDIPLACQILLSRRAYEVQVGLVNDRVFLVNASIGLYPELLEQREQAKRKLGRSRVVAMFAALGSLLRPHRLLRLEVTAKGGSSTFLTPTLFIGNNRLQLERVGIAESYVIERHRLVAVVLEQAGVLALFGLLLRAVLGRLGDAERVITFDFDRMLVRGRLGTRRFKVATDGEVGWLPSPLTFRVAPYPLLLLRPAEAGEDPG